MIIKFFQARDLAWLKRHVDGYVFPKKIMQNQKIMIYVDDTKYVAMVDYSIHDKSMCINYVHTNKKYRGNGYATKLIEKLLEISKDVVQFDVAILPDCGSDNIFKKFEFVYVEEHHMRLVR